MPGKLFVHPEGGNGVVYSTEYIVQPQRNARKARLRRASFHNVSHQPLLDKPPIVAMK
jgi:hypothetical protein